MPESDLFKSRYLVSTKLFEIVVHFLIRGLHGNEINLLFPDLAADHRYDC